MRKSTPVDVFCSACKDLYAVYPVLKNNTHMVKRLTHTSQIKKYNILNVIRDYKRFMNLSHVGKLHGISRETVRIIIFRAGLQTLKHNYYAAVRKSKQKIWPKRCHICKKLFKIEVMRGGQGLCRACYNRSYLKKQNYKHQYAWMARNPTYRSRKQILHKNTT